MFSSSPSRVSRRLMDVTAVVSARWLLRSDSSSCSHQPLLRILVGDAQIADVGELGDPGGEGDGGADGFCAVDAVAHGAVCALCDLSAVFGEGFCLAEGNVDAAEKSAVAGEIVQELGDELEIDGVGELMGGFVLEMVCLIDDDAVVFWQQAAILRSWKSREWLVMMTRACSQARLLPK